MDLVIFISYLGFRPLQQMFIIGQNQKLNLLIQLQKFLDYRVILKIIFI